MDPFVPEVLPFFLRQGVLRQTDDPRIKLDVVHFGPLILEDLAKAAARAPADEEDVFRPRVLKHGKMNGPFSRGRVRTRKYGKTARVKGDLASRPDQLQLPVGSVPAPDELERLPPDFLRGKIEEGECGEPARTARNQAEPFSPPEREEDSGGPGRGDERGAFPIGNERDQTQGDDESRERGPQGFEEIYARDVPAERPGVEDEESPQRKAGEEAYPQGEQERRPHSRKLSRKNS